MSDPQRLLNTLRRAARAFRETPGRTGRLVRPQGATEVLVAGDLHGHLENFRRLLTAADLASHPGRHLVLQELVHGPFRYPAGGDKSHQLLDLVAALKCRFPDRTHVLLGNHEAAQWTGQWIAKDGVESNDVFRAGVEEAYRDRADEVYASYLDLFSAMTLAVKTSNRIWLSHSLPAAKRLTSFDPVALECDWDGAAELEPGALAHGLLWGRDTRPETAAAFLALVDADLLVTGHIPCPDGFAAPNNRQLILDCMGAPACFCIIPADRTMSYAELLAGVQTL